MKMPTRLLMFLLALGLSAGILSLSWAIVSILYSLIHLTPLFLE